MTLPVIPISAAPLALPLRIARGDHGAAIMAHLIDGEGGRVYLPEGATVELVAVEQQHAPTRERRAARSFGGACDISEDDASLVSYTLLAADTAYAGIFDLAFVVIYPTEEVLTFPLPELEIE